MRAGAVTGTEHGASYWFHETEDIDFVVKDGLQSRVARFVDDSGVEGVRIDIDGIHCEPKAGRGIRPIDPVTVEYTENKKKKTLTLA